MSLDSGALFSVVLIVAYTALPGNGGAWSMFSPLVAQTQALAVKLLVLRVALDRSLTREDVAAMSSSHPTLPDSEAAQLNTSSSIASSSPVTPFEFRVPYEVQLKLLQFSGSKVKSKHGEDTRTDSSVY
ncbi:hypothetical protein BDV98DRAFT_597823 [Pterulicium gracile]|uniref:Uncharacterized protein n=1 Tax=Pterulicium gracile TaxID=1884261 RepID=A0A5C3Q2L9_9AGAR|nr:hypothetical protein BDV98DRAFT_597823 [Pterula gracilis]